MKDKLIIVGAGGHGKVVADAAIKMNKWSSIIFFDDKCESQSVLGCKVIGNLEYIGGYLVEHQVVIAVGNNEVRQDIVNRLSELDVEYATIIHPSSVIGLDTEIGDGSVVFAGAVINPDTTLGKHCIVNTSATIDHDNWIGDFVHLSPGSHTAGNVSMGDGVWLGIGACIKEGITIDANIIIGAGATVVKHLNEKGVYVGTPATILDR